MAIGQKIVLPPDNPSRAGRGPAVQESTPSESTRSTSQILTDDQRLRQPPPPSSAPGSTWSRRSSSQPTSTAAENFDPASERTPLIRHASSSTSSPDYPGLAPGEGSRGAHSIVSYDAVARDSDAGRRGDGNEDHDDYIRDSIPPPPYSDANTYWVRRPFGRRSRRRIWIFGAISLFLIGLIAVILWLSQSSSFRSYPRPVLPKETLPRHFANWSQPEAVVPKQPPHFATGLYMSTAYFDLPQNLSDLYVHTSGAVKQVTVAMETRHNLARPIGVIVIAYTSTKLRDEAVACFSELDPAKPSRAGLVMMTSDELQLAHGDALDLALVVLVPPADAYRIRNIKIEQHAGQTQFNMHPDTRTDTITIESPVSNIEIQSDLVVRKLFRLSALLLEMRIRSQLVASNISFESSSIFFQGGKIRASKYFGARARHFSAAFEQLEGPWINVDTDVVHLQGTVRLEGGGSGGLNVHANTGGIEVTVEVAPNRTSIAAGGESNGDRGGPRPYPLPQLPSPPEAPQHPPFPTWTPGPYPRPKPELPTPPARWGPPVNVSITNQAGNTSVVYSRWHPQWDWPGPYPYPQGLQRPGSTSRQGDAAAVKAGALWRHPLPYLTSMIASQSGSIRVEHDGSFVGAFGLVSERGGPAELRGPGYERGHGARSGTASHQRVLEVQTDHSKGSRVWIKGVVREVEDDDGEGGDWPARWPAATQSGNSGGGGDVSEVYSDSGKTVLIFD
ncbi:hypothetical protein OC834_000274 [Tilletia horrida]|nr:hypothetical protein OC834_000274 [Tilletia horrida]